MSASGEDAGDAELEDQDAVERLAEEDVTEDEVVEADVETEDASGRFSPTTWLLVDGNRFVVTGLFLLGTYAVLQVATTVIGPIAGEETSPMFYLFSALVGGNFTLVTIVISVSQLVISRQLGTPGEIRDQIEATNDFREEIEETTDVDVAPVTPTEFLHLLLQSAAEQTLALIESADGEDGEKWDELLEVVDQLSSHIGRVEDQLRNSDVTIVSALAVTLDTNYSADIYDLRILRAKYGDDYTEDVCEALDTLVIRLQQIDVGRQYIKTVYMQDELSMLSRNLLYVGVPALLASVFMLRAFSVGIETIPVDVINMYVPVAVAVSLAPLLLLFAYILRITTVARRTIAITPFTMAMRENERNFLD